MVQGVQTHLNPNLFCFCSTQTRQHAAGLHLRMEYTDKVDCSTKNILNMHKYVGQY